MERSDFESRMAKITEPMTEHRLRERIWEHMDKEKDLPICIGELSELILELTRYQRGKMDRLDFLQELSHVQWAVWTLQEIFDISDDKLHLAIQASFR